MRSNYPYSLDTHSGPGAGNAMVRSKGNYLFFKPVSLGARSVWNGKDIDHKQINTKPHVKFQL